MISLLRIRSGKSFPALLSGLTWIMSMSPQAHSSSLLGVNSGFSIGYSHMYHLHTYSRAIYLESIRNCLYIINS